MICLRCGYCCIAYDVMIISPKYICPDLDLFSPEIEHMFIHKKYNEVCPHLRWDGDKVVCAIHDYKWYKDTPCAQYGQAEPSPDTPCRIGAHFKKKGIDIKSLFKL